MKKLISFGAIVFLLVTQVNLACKKVNSCEGCAADPPLNGGNKTPIANAGPNQVVYWPVDSITLDGSGSSDPDGIINRFSWVMISGPFSVTINVPSAFRTTVINLAAGVYQFELTVIDNGGLPGKDTVQVLVDDPLVNHPPVAGAGPDQNVYLPVSSVNLDGSASYDPDYNIVSYEWKKIDGPSSLSLMNAGFVRTQATNLVEGEYQFELKVTDSRGAFSKDTMKTFVHDTVSGNPGADWEVIITLPIDSVFIDDYFRDTEGYCVKYISGPLNYTIDGGWVTNLVPGEYIFRRYWFDCITPAEIVKVTVLDDPNDRNMITYKGLIWEYNCGLNPSGLPGCERLYLSRPMWHNLSNPSVEVQLQMDFFNNGQWFPVPSNTSGSDFWLDCRAPNNCLNYFVITVNPEDINWRSRKANIKIKIH